MSMFKHIINNIKWENLKLVFATFGTHAIGMQAAIFSPSTKLTWKKLCKDAK